MRVLIEPNDFDFDIGSLGCCNGSANKRASSCSEIEHIDNFVVAFPILGFRFQYLVKFSVLFEVRESLSHCILVNVVFYHIGLKNFVGAACQVVLERLQRALEIVSEVEVLDFILAEVVMVFEQVANVLVFFI